MKALVRAIITARGEILLEEVDNVSVPSQKSPAGPPYDERANPRRLWGLFFALGLASIIVGLLAISFTFIAALANA